MFKIITNGAEPTLNDIRDNVRGVMAIFHENLFLDTDVVFVGSNKGREVEISKFTAVDGRMISKVYTSKGAVTHTLCNEYYKKGDNFYKARIINEVPWVIQTTREYGTEDLVSKKVTVYVTPQNFDLVEFVSYFFNIMTEVKKLDD